jgi:anti-sigma factor RsiW
VVGASAGWVAGALRPGQPVAMAKAPTTSIVQGATAAYRTFVVEVAHPVEVGAAQEAHLLQWLSKRLGHKLEAPDLAPFGYRLMGGRLLPAGSAAAAQLMYEEATGKRLTLYVRAADGTETAFRFQQDGDAATFAWIDQGFGFAVTATATRDELLPIAEAVYKGLTTKG